MAASQRDSRVAGTSGDGRAAPLGAGPWVWMRRAAGAVALWCLVTSDGHGLMALDGWDKILHWTRDPAGAFGEF
ncbi:hypothetical protein E4U54_000113 [Claviceps lovelessii]|nr:hypothetical protein E4U54_000113 [Claviceps lovelessii]